MDTSRFKMYKAGKFWFVAGAALVSVSLAGNATASADDTAKLTSEPQAETKAVVTEQTNVVKLDTQSNKVATSVAPNQVSAAPTSAGTTAAVSAINEDPVSKATPESVTAKEATSQSVAPKQVTRSVASTANSVADPSSSVAQKSATPSSATSTGTKTVAKPVTRIAADKTNASDDYTAVTDKPSGTEIKPGTTEEKLQDGGIATAYTNTGENGYPKGTYMVGTHSSIDEEFESYKAIDDRAKALPGDTIKFYVDKNKNYQYDKEDRLVTLKLEGSNQTTAYNHVVLNKASVDHMISESGEDDVYRVDVAGNMQFWILGEPGKYRTSVMPTKNASDKTAKLNTLAGFDTADFNMIVNTPITYHYYDGDVLKTGVIYFTESKNSTGSDTDKGFNSGLSHTTKPGKAVETATPKRIQASQAPGVSTNAPVASQDDVAISAVATPTTGGNKSDVVPVMTNTSTEETAVIVETKATSVTPSTSVAVLRDGSAVQLPKTGVEKISSIAGVAIFSIFGALGLAISKKRN